jgi:hypothetical protein
MLPPDPHGIEDVLIEIIVAAVRLVLTWLFQQWR